MSSYPRVASGPPGGLPGAVSAMRAATLNALPPSEAHFAGPAAAAGRTVTVAAPGRVNLIGEHTDYNDGWVLPLAIDRWVVMSGRKRPDSVVRVTALDREATAEFSLDTLTERSRADVGPGWTKYVAGVMWAVREAGAPLGGMDIAFTGNVPEGMGLSSSAALEVASGWLARALCDWDVSREHVALLSQKAENEFVGVACGIMDPFASALGRRGHAILLDCKTLEHRWIPFPEPHAALVVVHGDHGRALASSDYNSRRDECARAAAALHRMDPNVRTLRDADGRHVAWLDRTAAGYGYDDDRAVLARRARHVVEENRRVLDAVTALEQADVVRLGTLLNESHTGLSELFEVSTSELDRLVRHVRTAPGCYGARIVGGGFGGAVLALVRRSDVTHFLQFIRHKPLDGSGEGAGGYRAVRCLPENGVLKM